MKKRSLVVSIAMLLVSAIVLSTSTYAWFSTGATASVNQITAKISTSDGSIVVAATSDATTWGPSVSAADLAKVSGYYLPSAAIAAAGEAAAASEVAALVPIDATRTGNALSWKCAELKKTTSNNEITANPSGASATGKYINYSFYVKPGNSGSTQTITVKPTFSAGKNFLLGAVQVNNDEMKIYSTGNTISYKPIAIATAKTWTEALTGNCIVDDSDGSYAAGDLGSDVTTVGTTSDFTAITISGPTKIEVWIWAEGQEASCTGGATADASFSFDITSGAGTVVTTTAAG